MPHLRRSALAGLLLAVVPATALSACGFDYPTDRVNTIAGGVNERSGDVDALGIRILATAQGEGRLIGSLSNNLRDDASLDAVSSSAGIVAGEFEPVEVAGRGFVNLSTDTVVPLSGDFTAGQIVPLDLTFSDGTTLSLDVPVVKPCFQYTQVPTDVPSATASAKGGADAESDEATHEASDEASESHDANFSCADEAPSPGGGEAH
ncbi:hypothetical protein [Nocardioides sp. BYT-33-1]|uniref:hypothetical protein n=1 Tax=Nocardioides sp. BYT-33-1 TaxID=3416952 RepID=UPI003F53BF8E